MKWSNPILFLFLFFSVSAKAQYSWAPQVSGTTQQMNEIEFVNNFEGYCAGWGGFILKTGNGGDSWTSIPSPTTGICLALDFDTYSHGYLIDNDEKIFRTTTEAVSWDLMYSYPGGPGLFDVEVNGTNIVVAGNGKMLHSDDDGLTWDSTSVSIGIVWDVHMTTALVGYASGSDGEIAYTDDGGVTWSQTVGTPSANGKRCVHATTTSTIITAGDLGEIYRSTDGGDNWTQIPSGTTQTLESINFFNGTNGLIVGAGGTVLQTTDGGLTWVDVAPVGGASVYLGVVCTNAITAYICGSAGNIYRSPNNYDIAELAYIGPDTVCAGQPFDFSWTFKNIGGGAAQDHDFNAIINTNASFYFPVVFSGITDTGEVDTMTVSVVLGSGPNSIQLFSLDPYNTANNFINPTFNIEGVLPTPTDVSGDTFICPGDTVTMTASGGNSYDWLFSSVSDPSNPTQVFYPSQTEAYVVEITQDYCIVLDTGNVTLDPACDDVPIDSTIIVPTESYAFSPNGDHVNDILILDFLEDDLLNEVSIYNRWGDEVYNVLGYDNDENSWNGNYGGRTLPPGTYFFIATTSQNGVVRGWVELLR